MNSPESNQIDFTRGIVDKEALLRIASNGMVLSFEIRKSEEGKLYLVAYFGANSIQHRVPRTTAFVKTPLTGSLKENIDFIEDFAGLVSASWLTGIEHDKLKAFSVLTK